MIVAEDDHLLLAGPVTLETHLALRTESAAFLAERDVKIDLGNVTEVDSSALALVFFWQRQLPGHRVILCNVPAALLALAELYGVVELLDMESKPDPVSS